MRKLSHASSEKSPHRKDTLLRLSSVSVPVLWAASPGPERQSVGGMQWQGLVLLGDHSLIITGTVSRRHAVAGVGPAR